MEEKVMKDCKVLALCSQKGRGWQDNKLRESGSRTCKSREESACD